MEHVQPSGIFSFQCPIFVTPNDPVRGGAEQQQERLKAPSKEWSLYLFGAICVWNRNSTVASSIDFDQSFSSNLKSAKWLLDSQYNFSLFVLIKRFISSVPAGAHGSIASCLSSSLSLLSSSFQNHPAYIWTYRENSDYFHFVHKLGRIADSALFIWLTIDPIPGSCIIHQSVLFPRHQPGSP